MVAGTRAPVWLANYIPTVMLIATAEAAKRRCARDLVEANRPELPALLHRLRAFSALPIASWPLHREANARRQFP